MASQYFAILTEYGTRAFVQALSQGQPLQLTKFAVGDGNGKAVTPKASATALVHQTHIAPVSAVSLDPRNNKQIIVELTIPENIGGFYIREMGVFDSQNKLIAYANCPDSFKPTESSGSGKVQVLRMILKVESSSAVTLSIDNSVIFVTRQQMTPKTITATTKNGFDESGHTHEIDKATTSKAGIVQLSSENNSDDEKKAATPKAVKTAYDKAVSAEENNLYQKIYVGKDNLQLDLTDRQQIINLFGDKYRNNGHLSFVAHNNSNSNITGLPLTNKSPIVMTLYLMGGYSVFYCDYPLLNRRFYSNVNFNNNKLTFNWIEHITSTGDQLDIRGYKSFNSTVESKYRFVVRRNEDKYTPYMWLIDQSVDMSGATARNKSIGELTFSVGAGDGVRKNIIKSYILEDKNAFLELGGWDAENRYKVLFKGFTKTNNVTIGTDNDNGVDRLQVNGTISANTPPVNATDDKVVTVRWLREYFAKQADINNVRNELNNTYRKNRFRHQHYPNHYNGAEVFDIPMGDRGVMRVIVMNVHVYGYANVSLPEAYNGSCMVQATDVGREHKAVGVHIQNGHSVDIYNVGEVELNILTIGWFGW